MIAQPADIRADPPRTISTTASAVTYNLSNPATGLRADRGIADGVAVYEGAAGDDTLPLIRVYGIGAHDSKVRLDAILLIIRDGIVRDDRAAVDSVAAVLGADVSQDRRVEAAVDPMVSVHGYVAALD